MRIYRIRYYIDDDGISIMLNPVAQPEIKLN